MKKKYNIILKCSYIISLVAAVMTVIMIILAPETIPIHYNLNSVADSYGSKWIFLIFPVALVIQVIYWAKRISHEIQDRIESSCYTALASSILFSGITLFFSIRMLDKMVFFIELVKQIEIYGFISFLAGVTFIIMGFAISKAPYNSNIGIKTGWSTKNNESWDNTQKACMKLFIIIGILMIVQVFFVSGILCLICLILEAMIASIISIMVAYIISSKVSSI